MELYLFLRNNLWNWVQFQRKVSHNLSLAEWWIIYKPKFLDISVVTFSFKSFFSELKYNMNDPIYFSRRKLERDDKCHLINFSATFMLSYFWHFILTVEWEMQNFWKDVNTLYENWRSYWIYCYESKRYLSKNYVNSFSYRIIM